MSWSSEPFREQQRGAHEDREHHRQRQTDDVLEAHRRSTNFCTRPSSAKIATVSTRYMTTPISPFTVHDHARSPQAATARR